MEGLTFGFGFLLCSFCISLLADADTLRAGASGAKPEESELTRAERRDLKKKKKEQAKSQKVQFADGTDEEEDDEDEDSVKPGDVKKKLTVSDAPRELTRKER